MRHDNFHSRRIGCGKAPRVFVIIGLCLFLFFALLFCYRWLLGLMPPDLSGCTQMDIEYQPSSVAYIALGTQGDGLLDRAEKTYLESHETFTVMDVDRIKAFALDIRSGSFNGRSQSKPYLPAAYITCYRNEKRVVSLHAYDRTVINEFGRVFEYPEGLPNLEIIEPSEMLRLKLRFVCARNMGSLYTVGPLWRRKVLSYPESERWCDTIVKFCRTQYAIRNGVKMRLHKDKLIADIFACPSALKIVGIQPNSPQKIEFLSLESNYAMNPNCRPDSPGDMVLLFETKGGWNQHGGPELFTFDNHDPKGGCVLLNDGTVKFIRTKEELQQLRWK